MLPSIRNTRLGRAVLGAPAARAGQESEREPLLGGAAAGLPAPTPLPVSASTSALPHLQLKSPSLHRVRMRQILLLCLMRLSEPIAYSCIFPFIAQMIEHLKISDKPEKVGYYAGVIEGCFALSTFATVVAWGRISDRVGRKPVLVLGLVGVSFSVLSFGFSTTFAGLVVSRCVGGAINGNAGVMKSMFGELSDESNQAQAFSFLPLSWAIGGIVGPLLGGFLAQPAMHYPRYFDTKFFRDYPFALPCIVGSTFSFSMAFVGGFLLEETLKKAGPKLDESRTPHSSASSTATITPNTALSKPPPFTDVFTHDVLFVLSVYMLLALEAVALDAVHVLFCYTRIASGGLSFSELDIGKVASMGGVATVFFQVVVFPKAQRRFGTIPLYRFFLGLYPIVFALLPLCAAVARQEEGTGSRRGTWTVVGVYVVVKAVANCSFACNMIAVTNAAPSRQLLGTLNGVAQMCSSLMRAIGPFIASSLFAFSLEKLGSPNVLMSGLAVMGVVTTAASFALSTEAARWRKVEAEQRDEQERER